MFLSAFPEFDCSIVSYNLYTGNAVVADDGIIEHDKIDVENRR